MKRMMAGFGLAALFTLFPGATLGARAQDSMPEASDPGLRIRSITAQPLQSLGVDPLKRRMYAVEVTQPLDHDQAQTGAQIGVQTGGATFVQRVLLTHRGFDRPTVLIIEGYAMEKNYLGELARLLDANEIRVEHRYFGRSLPGCMDWSKLNLHQATLDYHRIVSLFKRAYPGPWVAAGWSKGGETALAFRRHFPEDVAATVAYDAPVNAAQEDARIDAFFGQVGTPECRKKLIEFQRTALKAKSQVLPLLTKRSLDTGWYCPLGVEAAFEYAVLEYPFSFWQYTSADCATIPGPEATPQQIYEAVAKVSGFSSYGVGAFNSASMWQFFEELGYYGFVTEPVKDLLNTFPRKLANAEFAPAKDRLVFRPQVMRDITAWLQTKGNRILYLYGDQDPWAATRITGTEKTSALVMALPKGNHFTFIETFPKPDQERMLDTLRTWMEAN